jgi:hypothetical protein
MSTKPYRWIFASIGVLSVIVLAMLSLPSQASAETPTEAVENSCFSCHEELYYLHDSGKHCCITEHADRCVDCHEGNKTVMNREESHQGLLVHPQENHGEKCLECHTPEVTRARLAEMASTVGFDTVIKVDAYEPVASSAGGFTGAREVDPLRENMFWVAGSIGVFGLWLLLVLTSPTKP